MFARGYNLLPSQEQSIAGDGVYILTAPHTPLAIAVLRERGRPQVLFSFTDQDFTSQAKWADVSYAPVATGAGPQLPPTEATSLQSQAQRLIEVLDGLEVVARRDLQGASRRLNAQR